MPSNGTKPTRTLKGLVMDSFVKFSKTNGQEPPRLQNPLLTPTKNYKNHPNFILTPIKCSEMLFNGTDPTRTLSGLIKNGSMKVFLKNMLRAPTPSIFVA